MLGMLLAEDPTWKHLQGMLGHFTEFLNAEDPETQVEALIMAGSLERLAARCGIYCSEGVEPLQAVVPDSHGAMWLLASWLQHDDGTQLRRMPHTSSASPWP
ncbi:hypothetical protein lerEdw1_021055 [Lerista edwardsae]|nr:hypothetical protein lerEdw1_021055 [Lerista edwardsae]